MPTSADARPVRGRHEGAAGIAEPGTRPPDDDDPEAALRAALSAAPHEGISVAELVAITRMSRRWIYYRLGELAADGHVEQTPAGYGASRAGTTAHEPQPDCANRARARSRARSNYLLAFSLGCSRNVLLL